MCAKKKTAESQREIRNAKANHNYFVGDRLECGIVLLGTGFHESDQFRTPYYDAAIRDVVGPEVELPDPEAAPASVAAQG